MSQNKLKTVNSENLFPLSRKRIKSTVKSTAHSSKLTKLEQTEALQEEGISMLDSEESSSPMSSAIALGLVASDENSNEATPHVDAPKFFHHHRMIYQHSVDTSLDNSDVGINMNDLKAINGDTATYAMSRKTQSANEPASPHVASSNFNVSPTTSRKTRSPLATVATNSQHPNTQISQNFQSAVNNSNHAHLGIESSMHGNLYRPQSPSLPSTSHQAALHKQKLSKQHQQQLHLQKPQQNLKHAKDVSISASRFNVDTTDTNEKEYFSKMSDEIILHIFKFLPKKALFRCNLVCRRFNNCAKDSTLWTRLDLGCRTLRPHAMENIVTRGLVILRLAQAELKHPVFTEAFLSIHPQIETKLQYLDLSMATITKASLTMLLSRCRKLKKLSLEHVPVNNEICQEIAKNYGLEALNLSMCTGLEAWSIRNMLESLKNLSSLNISWTNLSVDAVTSLVTTVSPNILRLNVAGCRKTMFDTHLSTLVERCPQILELDLSDCTGLTGNAVIIICKFKMLEYLSLSRCYLIPAAAYMELKNMSTLTYLDVFGLLSDSAMEMLELYLPTLGINKFHHSSVARPTVGTRRTSIWGLRTRD